MACSDVISTVYLASLKHLSNWSNMKFKNILLPFHHNLNPFNDSHIDPSWPGAYNFSVMIQIQWYNGTNSMEKPYYFHPDSNIVITTKFCTGHDSSAVVLCAKIWSYLMTRNSIIKSIFHWIWILRERKITGEIGPKTSNKLYIFELLMCRHSW